jgi:hypothetical protein
MWQGSNAYRNLRQSHWFTKKVTQNPARGATFMPGLVKRQTQLPQHNYPITARG